MFNSARCISNSVSINFERVLNIRRSANSFEDLLSDRYSHPNVLPVPDDFEPNAPRIIFESTHGYSQIVISQLNITLNVSYSLEWQENSKQRLDYLHNRSQSLLEILPELKILPTYCGLLTNCVLPTSLDDNQILNHIKNTTGYTTNEKNLSEISIRNTSVIDNLYFSHIEVSNYRKWNPTKLVNSPQRFISENVTERGIIFFGDFNDRYSFNENENYSTSQDAVNSIIDLGSNTLEKYINKFLE